MKQIEIPFLIGDEVIIKNYIDGEGVFAIDIVEQIVITDDDFKFICKEARRPIRYNYNMIMENSMINRIKIKQQGFKEIGAYMIN